MKPSRSASAPKKGPKLLVIIPLALLAIVLLFFGVVYAMGGSDIDEGIPAIGVVPADVPFTGQGQDEITIRWQVKGGSALTGVYFGPLPGQADFAQSVPPDQAGYEAFAVGTSADGTVFEARLPNAYPLLHLRIYALIGGTHYWSNEFEVSP